MYPLTEPTTAHCSAFTAVNVCLVQLNCSHQCHFPQAAASLVLPSGVGGDTKGEKMKANVQLAIIQYQLTKQLQINANFTSYLLNVDITLLANVNYALLM